MLLSLLGRPTSREEALDLFRFSSCSSDYQGTPLVEVAKTLIATRIVRTAKWTYYRTLQSRRFFLTLSRLAKVDALPTMIWFGIRHIHTGKYAKHYAVVVGVKGDEILLLDPLGQNPVGRRRFNVSMAIGNNLNASKNKSPPYSIAKRQEAALLMYEG